ncbi:MAG: PEGA domain-containing protein [Candidatus Omnitrophota bacterium]
MSHEQRIRTVLFYLSLTIFLLGLPFILSFALGYKFNKRTFKFTKTGLVALKTQPQGASIYLNGRLLNDKTSATINELLPGKYNIRLELEKYYPWFGEVDVEGGRVTRLEKIIFFPLRSNIKQLNKNKISSYWVDKEKEKIYYVNQQDSIIYRSDLEGDNFKEVGTIPKASIPLKKWKPSPDQEKLLGFSQHQIAVIYLIAQNGSSPAGYSFILNYPDRNIVDIFWHSDSYHLVLVTDKNIGVLEASRQAAPVNLVNLNKETNSVFYDDAKDALYFLDPQEAPDGQVYDNTYKLELSVKAYPFQGLIKPRPNE